jgi:serpin B
VQFVLPDEGRFEEVAGELAEAFDALGGHGTEAALTVPRFETRTDVQLDAALQALGLTAPYDGGHLNGMVDDDRLVIDRTLHQTFVAVDEEGTEAAAATIVVGAFLRPVSPPVDVVLDRPFYFRIVDQASGATLFQGRIMDPS